MSRESYDLSAKNRPRLKSGVHCLIGGSTLNPERRNELNRTGVRVTMARERVHGCFVRHKYSARRTRDRGVTGYRCPRLDDQPRLTNEISRAKRGANRTRAEFSRISRRPRFIPAQLHAKSKFEITLTFLRSSTTEQNKRDGNKLKI